MIVVMSKAVFYCFLSSRWEFKFAILLILKSLFQKLNLHNQRENIQEEQHPRRSLYSQIM